MAGDQAVHKRHVTVALSKLAFDAVAGGTRGSDPSLGIENALLCYLGDRGTDRPAWSYPGFLRGSEARHDVEIEIEVGTGLWQDFEEEASRQGVTVEQLVEHAAFYFAAELDAGRFTQRILEDLDLGQGESTS